MVKNMCNFKKILMICLLITISTFNVGAEELMDDGDYIYSNLRNH